MSKDPTKQILSELKSLRKELGQRLDQLESRLDGLPPSAVKPYQGLTDVRGSGRSMPTELTPGPAHYGPATRNVAVKIQPLRDLGMARLVESALVDTEGVESATLRELRGDSAIIDARVGDGVALISSLRRKLPVAFDVTDSDRGSFTIALARPDSQPSGGEATHEVQ